MKKKILSLMLAVVMMLSLSVTALAYTDANEDGEPEDESTITISKSYILEGEGTSPAETFYLVQTGATVTDSTCQDDDIPALVAVKDEDNNDVTKTINDVAYNVVGTVSFEAGDAGNSGNTEHPVTTKSFTITLPEYEKVGVYTYTLQEVAGTTAGVTYRTNTITLVVQVYNNENYDADTDPESEKFIRVAAVHTEDTTDSTSEKSDTFTDNTYSANNLLVTKTVEGNLGDKSEDETFNFTVTFTTPSGKTWTPNVTAKVDGADYDITLTETTKGSGIYTATFSLSHDQTITFYNIPEDVSYVISEVDESNAAIENKGTNGKYTVTYDDYKTGTIGGSATDEDVDSVSTTVTNTYEGTVDTGISLDSLPYILMLIIVAAGVVLLISRKRLNDRF